MSRSDVTESLTAPNMSGGGKKQKVKKSKLSLPSQLKKLQSKAFGLRPSIPVKVRGKTSKANLGCPFDILGNPKAELKGMCSPNSRFHTCSSLRAKRTVSLDHFPVSASLLV